MTANGFSAAAVPLAADRGWATTTTSNSVSGRPSGTRRVRVPSLPVFSVAWIVCMIRVLGCGARSFYLRRTCSTRGPTHRHISLM